MFLWSGNTLSRGYRIRDALRQAVGAVQYARMQAAIRNQNYRMQFCPYNKTCRPYDKTSLKTFGLITPALAGFWFIEQCPTASLTGSSVCGDPGQRQELKFYDLARAYRDVELYQLNTNAATIVDDLVLYFRPDGRIMGCTKNAVGAVTCTPGTYYMCFRASLSEAKNGPNAIPRRVEISFAGRIKIEPDGNKTICK